MAAPNTGVRSPDDEDERSRVAAAIRRRWPDAGDPELVGEGEAALRGRSARDWSAFLGGDLGRIVSCRVLPTGQMRLFGPPSRAATVACRCGAALHAEASPHALCVACAERGWLFRRVAETALRMEMLGRAAMPGAASA